MRTRSPVATATVEPSGLWSTLYASMLLMKKSSEKLGLFEVQLSPKSEVPSPSRSGQPSLSMVEVP